MRVAPEAADLHPTACTGPTMVALPARAPDVRLEVLVDGGGRGTARSRAGGILGTARIRRRPGIRAHRDGADRHPQPSPARGPRRGRKADRRRGGEDRRRRRDSRPRRKRHARLLQRAGRNPLGFPGRLVPHRRHRRVRRGRAAPHPRTQEGNDCDAGRTQRLSGGRGAGAQRAARRARIRCSRRARCRQSRRARPRDPCARTRRRRRGRRPGANATLADHQRIRAAVVWPGPELPRTEGTRKLKRRELRQWLSGQQTGAPSRGIRRARCRVDSGTLRTRAHDRARRRRSTSSG